MVWGNVKMLHYFEEDINQNNNAFGILKYFFIEKPVVDSDVQVFPHTLVSCDVHGDIRFGHVLGDDTGGEN